MLRFGVLLFFPLFLTSCETISFYTQAFTGQAEIILVKRPIKKVLADPETTPKLAAKLKLAQEIVDFAESDLALDSSGSYHHYADLKRDHVTYIVYAAPELSLEPKTWWYPVIGRQDYRGYFKKEKAQKLIDKLEAEGLETFTGGVNAYSTLGFFNDPLLNTFIDYPDVDFAELIFHELTHHRYYEKDNTPRNEALAEVVAREGTRRWLRKKGDLKALETYELRLKRRAEIRKAIIATIDKLEQVYHSEQSDEQKRAAKKEQLAQLKKEITRLYAGWQQRPDNFLSKPLNNARLNAFTTYEEFVPEFEKLLEKHNNQLEPFFQEVEKGD